MRDHMDRRVTPTKRVTSPTWGPTPPRKQALNQLRHKQILSTEHWLLDRFVDLVVMLLKKWPSQSPNLSGAIRSFHCHDNICLSLPIKVVDLFKVSFMLVSFARSGQYAVYKVTQNHGLQTRVNDLSYKISFSAIR